MITLEQAKQSALEYIRPSAEHIRKEIPKDDLVIEHFVEFDDCWLFYINSKLYLETHDIHYRLLGGGAVIVGKKDGDIYQGSSVGTEEDWVNDFRQHVRNRAGKGDKDIFISYSRHDQEFVTRLAADLDAHVAGVWIDQSTIQLGQKWHDEILEGIRECKASIVVLSPDAMASKYVREELEMAKQLGKPIFPVIYRPAKWTDEFASLVKDIQTIDLRSGSYTDSFHTLVDGLIAAGVIKTTAYERPFLREPTTIGLSVVFRKALNWALAWGLGWLIFWAAWFIFLFIFIAIQNKAGWEDILNFLVFSFSGLTGGLMGGLVAGTLSMFTLRPYAPSIFWKHISPTLRIWAVSGPVGMMISSIITVIMLVVGVISTANTSLSCRGISDTQCLSHIFNIAYREDIRTIILIIVVFFLFVIVIWFITGMLAGWLVVRHVRRLEPGITTRQGWNVATGWGCGAVVAALIAALMIGILANAFHL